MPIIAKNTGSTFEPCPAGMQQAVCVDVVDLGLQKSNFQNEDGTDKWQHKIEIVWQSSEHMKDGRPYLVKKRYTLSLNEKANLRHDLESWRGKPFTDDEVNGFDVERLIGVNANLNIVHKAGSKGGMFANVSAIAPLMRQQTRMTATPDYVRVCDRPAANESNGASDGDDDFRAADDDSIPF
jgi:hypothetical protein